jgi:integrase
MAYNKKHIQPLMEQAQKLRRHCRQGSYKTRERYFAAFKRFLAYLAEVYGLQKIANISGKHLAGYVRQMRARELSAATVKTDLAAIRFWHDQIPLTKHRLPENTAFDLERRSFLGHDRTWTEEEFAHMIAAAEEHCKPGYAAAMMLARYLGLRIHEVLRIDAAAHREALKTGVLTVKGKGGKVRHIPCFPPAEQMLRRHAGRAAPGQKLLLPMGKPTHLAIKELQQFIADHRPPRAERPITFHGLRHMFAAEAYQRLIAEGETEAAARLQVSRWLGHERENVTEIYLASMRERGGI